MLSTKSPNNVVLLENGNVLQIFEMYSFKKTNEFNNIYLKGKILEILPSDFNYPCNASDLKIFKVKVDDFNKDAQALLKDVDIKMILMTIYELPEDDKDSWVAPLLHM